MNTNFRTIPATLAVIGFCALTSVSSIAAQAAHDRDFNPDGLVGTWQVQVALHDCQSGAAIGAPFHSLLTFADGGTLTESTANAMFFPAIRGAGHGVWSRVHRRHYSAASIAFITMNGALVKMQKISQTIDMGPNPDEFTTPQASVQFFDPAGNLLMTGCATAVGERFEG